MVTAILIAGWLVPAPVSTSIPEGGVAPVAVTKVCLSKEGEAANEGRPVEAVLLLELELVQTQGLLLLLLLAVLLALEEGWLAGCAV